jgi:hypothetical protein
LDGKPGEETTLWGCPSLPDNVAELTWQRGEELDFVGRAGRVASIRGQGPGYGVLRVWEELDIREKIPKPDVLLHMFNSEIIDRDVRDPVMVMESISNCPILSPGGLENQGGKVLWWRAMKPGRGPEGGLGAVSDGDTGGGIKEVNVGGVIGCFRTHPRLLRSCPLVPQPA